MKAAKILLGGAAAARASRWAGAGLRSDRSAKASPCTCRWAATPATARRSPARPARRRRPRRFGVDLKEQFSAWAPETMINQFKEAVAAKPTCIEIMGHPGSTAFHDIVKQAVDQGIIVTVGNSPMTDLQDEFGTKGMGYAGVDLYVGGKITAEYMLAQGLKAGDEAMVYGAVQPGRARPVGEGPRRHAREGRPQGRPARDHPGGQQRRDARDPVLTAYIQAHPNLKAIGTQHGGITGMMAEILRRPARSPATSSSAASTSRRRRSMG